MSSFNLQQKFPNLTPISSPPSLFTINGCGCAIYGDRDHDAETGTYVKTHVLCLLFVPVLALGAYRVATAPQGWYFIGREPLSLLAKGWNVLVVLGVLLGAGGVGVTAYVESPGYKARQALARADRLLQEGKTGEASSLYAGVAMGQTEYASQARERIEAWLSTADANSPPADVEAMFRTALQLHQQTKWTQGAEALLKRGRELAAAQVDADPKSALRLLDLLEPLVKDRQALAADRFKPLENIVAREPNNVDAVVRLAELYEAGGDLERCELLLVPIADKLATTEGARILGEIYAKQEKLNQAHELLLPYCEFRLARLHQFERALESEFEASQRRAISNLEAGGGSPLFRAEYPLATKERQGVLVRAELEAHFKNDPALSRARDAVAKEADIVPVALELGVVLLRRGQELEDPAARQAELEKAEQTFLAVRGIAGETKEFRLYLGQVYYWLGKHQEGKTLFDELLAAENRKFETLLGVSGLLREVGAFDDSRTLAEEAYNQETDAQKKFRAAGQRAVLFTDFDDELLWLKRGDPTDPHIAASLSQSLGHQAQRAGNEQEAIGHFRAALQAFLKQTETNASLNNAAGAAFRLYHVSGNKADFDQCLALMDKAVALAPGNSILLYNAAGMILDGGLTQIVGAGLDLRLVQRGGTVDQLRYLYRNEQERRDLEQRVAGSAEVARALELYDRGMLLAPKSEANYREAAEVYAFTRNSTALAALRRRVVAAQPESSERNRTSQEFQAGTNDEKFRQQLQLYRGQMERALQELGPDRRDATFALVVSSVIATRMSLGLLGEPLDTQELLRLAEQAHTGAPSAGTLDTLVNVLSFRAVQSLAAADAQFAALAKRHQRELAHEYVLAIALARPGTMRDAVLANEDFRRVQQLAAEDHRAFPNTGNSWAWAILRFTHEAEAASLVKATVSDQGRLEQVAFSRRLSPDSLAYSLQAAWDLELAGKTAEAEELVKPLFEPPPVEIPKAEVP